jgi:hypothetical protein
MKCSQCNHKQYRKTLCRRCYKKFRKNHFHCTHGTCYKPVFSATLCQFHYRYYQTSCLLCDKKPYCRTLCKKHYKERSVNGDFPPEPSCIKCSNNVYVQSLCLKHFKEKYDSDCIMVGCGRSSFRRGLCCRHYFKERRRIENKNRI